MNELNFDNDDVEVEVEERTFDYDDANQFGDDDFGAINVLGKI